MFSILRNIIALIVLGALVYFVSNYFGVLQEKIGVKGVSTQRAEEVKSQLLHEAQTQIDVLGAQAMRLSLGDVLGGFSRFQKIPKDVNDIKNYLGQQYTSVIESGKKREE
jgi:hypothetical protein